VFERVDGDYSPILGLPLPGFPGAMFPGGDRILGLR
jgi:hypothetical protein